MRASADARMCVILVGAIIALGVLYAWGNAGKGEETQYYHCVQVRSGHGSDDSIYVSECD
jgi:hypothetical protein